MKLKLHNRILTLAVAYPLLNTEVVDFLLCLLPPNVSYFMVDRSIGVAFTTPQPETRADRRLRKYNRNSREKREGERAYWNNCRREPTPHLFCNNLSNELNSGLSRRTKKSLFGT